jgi:hypothetical protein
VAASLQQPWGPALEILCRYSPAAERKALWESFNGPVPPDRRIGWTCGTPYCGKLRHMRLMPNLNFGQADYRPIRKQVQELRSGEFFDLGDVTDVSKFRCGLNAGLGQVRVSVRSLGEGRVRVTRLNRWVVFDRRAKTA